MRFHIMPSNMEHNEREGMQECKDEKGVGDPSVEDLKFFVRSSREQRNPVRLARRCTE
jgi:hypothetical protein